MKTAIPAFLAIVALAGASIPGAQNVPPQTTMEENVVYGMYSGLALLMDVHRPVKPNGLGVLYVPGCAWHAPLAAGSPQLKNLNTGIPFVDQFNHGLVDPLLDAGYTVFVVNPTGRTGLYGRDDQVA